MDEVVGDEVTEPMDSTHIRNKESEFLLKPGSSNMLQSDQMVTPGLDDYPENSRNVYSDILDGRNQDRVGSSDHASASPRCMDDAGVMVEELTMRNYDGENVIGTSNNIERMPTRRNQWQHLYQISGGQTGFKGKGQASSSGREDNYFSGLLDQNQPLNHNAVMDNLLSNDDKGASGDMLYSSGGIRTKILSKSGFSEYFIKNSLRGKGVTYKSPACRETYAEAGSQDYSKFGVADPAAPLGLTAQHVSPPSNGDGISLREWLEVGHRQENKVKSLHIFRQVLDLVDFAHSNGISLQDLKPSCFKLLESDQVIYLGSSQRAGVTENDVDQDIHQSSHNQNEKRPAHHSVLPLDRHSLKKRKLGENMNVIQRWPQFPSRSGRRSIKNVGSSGRGYDVDEDRNLEGYQSKSFSHNVPSSLQDSVSSMLEDKWYTSPEMFSDKSCTFASNIYCLGVLLFELLGSFDSGRSHAATMQDLSHRILPPSFLSGNPKEAGFCLWLLHPEPTLRPTTRKILQSVFVSENQEIPEGQLLSSINEEDGESELLLHFLLSLNEQKQKDASTLVEQIQRIEADIAEVEKRRPKKILGLPSSSQDSFTAWGNYTYSGDPVDVLANMPPVSCKETKLMGNIRQLESAYFSMRSNIQPSESDVAIRRDGELLTIREKRYSSQKEENNYDTEDCLGGFFDGLCKYARYSKFKERGILRNGEFNNSANVICSLSFDRDEDYLATGGVSKKIKVFEFQGLFNNSVDIHYPVVEMANKSRLSCISWNSYIRNYIASTDYDGIVKLWDAATGQVFSNFTEHSERAWSVDFSRVDPTKLASGSDDRLVKLWSINDKNSLCTIRNNANVCSVQFSADSAHLLAFSSADYKTYCYDLRNVSTPWCILAGHEKAVSYAKFLDAGTLVSASTDNTLKIWDLSKTSSNSLSRNACILTLKGHTNEKNFVGLSVADGYITCGSETNEVFAYYKSLPMPITSHKFGSVDPITGKDTEDDNGQFVSSVCWRRKSNMVVAANSSGCIKLLQIA